MKNFIQLEDYQAAYTVTGTGKPLILLHGFFGDAWTLNNLVEELKSEFQCFNLELLGFGDSAKPKINYLISDQVVFLQSFIEALALEDYYLVGYSYGAWVASAYAIAAGRGDFSSTLNSIALLAPTGIRDDSFTGRYDHLKPLLWETPIVDWAIAALRPMMAIAGQKDYFETIVQARNAMMSQPAAAAFLKSRLRPEDAVDTVEQELHHVQCLSLVLAAGNDKHIPFWHCETYQEKISNAQLFKIENADHDFVQTHSTEIAHILRTNFKQSAPAQTMMQRD
ncbi:alpha/beta fold hydrolase [[Limnothrix rosea] IAM M-220]|uniref:alpha/beta fold hydrolase n=1 Tax=[Limnothrix rosea] IAM M-220 TaxID=454133 RepID=UPI00095AC3F2|nr:alpha/beta hydrolase [[Limnothrix rosea] IAM M-220]OKH12137.1 alpha/beta hydrolase [[Limnothrix rosea] IAM M-220]